jgi:hypothetical protein
MLGNRSSQRDDGVHTPTTSSKMTLPLKAPKPCEITDITYTTVGLRRHYIMMQSTYSNLPKAPTKAACFVRGRPFRDNDPGPVAFNNHLPCI